MRRRLKPCENLRRNRRAMEARRVCPASRMSRVAYVPRRARRRPDAPWSGAAPNSTRDAQDEETESPSGSRIPVGCVAKARVAPYLRSVTDDVLTMQELRRRRAEIFDLSCQGRGPPRQ
jgi:hypothetical protein